MICGLEVHFRTRKINKKTHYLWSVFFPQDDGNAGWIYWNDNGFTRTEVAVWSARFRWAPCTSELLQKFCSEARLYRSSADGPESSLLRKTFSRTSQISPLLELDAARAPWRRRRTDNMGSSVRGGRLWENALKHLMAGLYMRVFAEWVGSEARVYKSSKGHFGRRCYYPPRPTPCREYSSRRHQQHETWICFPSLVEFFVLLMVVLKC